MTGHNLGKRLGYCLLGVLLLACGLSARAAEPAPPAMDHTVEQIEAYLLQAMQANKIPGLALAVVDGRTVYLSGLGKADLQTGRAVTPDTLFEIGSCTKAFTGLAAALMQSQGRLDFRQGVNRYLPLYYALWQGKSAIITIDQLLHHTSGISASTIVALPAGDQDYAWQKTALGVAGLGLIAPPGKEYEYATVNYDLAAAAMQAVSGQDYADYLTQNILGPLSMSHSLVGAQTLLMASHPEMAQGYRRSFFKPRPDDPPVFRGNFPAGYVVSSARDMALWLKFQLGISFQPGLSPLVPYTHQPQVPEDMDQTISHALRAQVDEGENSGLYYALGWEVAPDGTISHLGVNPTFTAYVGFVTAQGKGVVILTNGNSSAVANMGQGALDLLLGKPAPPVGMVWGGPEVMDLVASLACLVFVLLGLGLLALMLRLLLGLAKGDRAFRPLGPGRLLGLVLVLAAWPLAALGLYLLPQKLLGGTWPQVSVWMPASLPLAAVLALAAFTLLVFWLLARLLFPKTSPQPLAEAQA